MARHYQRVLEHLQMVQGHRPNDELIEVGLALAYQCFFLSDEESHYKALSLILNIVEYDGFEHREQAHKLLLTLRKMVQILTHPQASSHAHEVAQRLLHFLETYPTEFDQTHKQAWLAAKDELFKLVKNSSSTELFEHLYYFCGMGYLNMRECQQALTCFENILKLHPNSGLAYVGLGWTHNALKECQQATEDLTHGLQLAPLHFHPLIYLLRGSSHRKLNAYQQALSDLDHAIQLDRTLVGAHNSRAMMYMALKEYQKALRDLDSALELAPDHPVAGLVLFRQGCAHLWLKDLAQATTCFTRGHELGSTSGLFPWAQDLLRWAREWSAMCQTSPDTDLQTLRHLQVLSGGELYMGRVCRGVTLWLQKEFQQALAELQHAVTLRFDEDWRRFLADYWGEWDVHFWLGMAYLALDQEEEARVAIERALAFEMPPILLRPLCWFEQEKPKLYEQLVQPLLTSYGV